MSFDKYNFYFGQEVTKEAMNNTLSWIEFGFQQRMVDFGWYGIVPNPYFPTYNFNIDLDSPVSWNVRVDRGIAYNRVGHRIIRASNDDLTNCEVDYNGNPTSPSAGKERYISIIVFNNSAYLDPRYDDDGVEIYHQVLVSHELKVYAGNEADPGLATPPTFPNNGVKICDILLDDAVTAINGFGTAAGEIDFTNKQLWKKQSSYEGFELRAYDRLVVEKNLGEPPEEAGPYNIYGESFVRAWGLSAGGPTPDIESSYNIANFIRWVQGEYIVTLPTGLFDTEDDYGVLVTTNIVPTFCVAGTRKVTATEFRIYVYDSTPILVDEFFDFVVIGRPSRS